MKRIIFTGGGSAGHVTPNLAIIPHLQEKGWDISYIGSHQGIEKTIIENEGISYYGIASGKLRRYFDLKNIKDPFLVMKGVMDAYVQIRKLKPDVIFSKGGFVSVPVVIGGWLNRVPVLLHESDMTPGLANKIALRFASKIFVTFEEAAQHLPKDKVVYTGSPVREEVLRGSREKGLRFLGFHSRKPVITVMGGSLGAKKINETVREALPQLLKNYQVVHLCGKGNLDKKLQTAEGYRQFEYVHGELPDVLGATDFVISRAGSNAIFEFLTLQKPMILIPLPKASSRGDQILNAQSFERQGYAAVLYEEDISVPSLMEHIEELNHNCAKYKKELKKYNGKEAVQTIMKYIKEA
ncbi:undecaprenyldiphospho-muramoylpentapeptide beta-N-acetylglucosaminyltransferase [Bacillus pseudomycoides]|uniref:UDP-N-acetylglucosamine--N-acetylmuramyl-(pentapeptide) pyrophosphoryl-undecaprenol N-acetylglucosamine transferase n=1 Tax=Bacillus pseudomycoides TaxID=64104 RepID=A0AA91ZUE9_9BACI|nr:MULTISPECIES: undecaprenyldiphospho-muramoylpentapeptide beta-N-acetylglucosaminyltransferase [Bacillus]PEB53345.1 undecaprenyldiphospho-muramoylpentapeptide beta-N-acetylglucosaminyltransferase [Bacillus sp. AFS098217]PED83786.1 undecaprenyldiphospho-muramoylpentapeptide beta-N-acetylglucosaminyltransferase [Bacillus pseudomycoides]PEU19504.1 undecaprenyldiphospho-muramoylpentapeptide beta-N-acetylglucosaminyltransferase [Bacillus sp. AFS014408]PFW64415.1 undecaprenyldiphospho-muramoylpenta